METEDWKSIMFCSEWNLFHKTLLAKSPSIAIGKLVKSLREQRPQSHRFMTLDLGCGTGRLTPQFSVHSSVVVGLDFSSELLNIAVNELNQLSNAIFLKGDFRNLDSMFTPSTFDLIFRAYTSLGYYSYETELDILKKCNLISNKGGKIVLDTFNAAFFRSSGNFERRTIIEQGFPSLELIEKYCWNNIKAGIDCCWSYKQGSSLSHQINFFLEGYDYLRVSKLLSASGWCPLMSGDEFDHLSYNMNQLSDTERLVVVASIPS